MKTMRVGIIGMGLIGKQHAESINRIPGIELVAVTIRNEEMVESITQQFNVKTYTDYKEMIAKEQLDVIHNCTPNALHFEINKYALEHNIHVYSEKPLAMTVKEGEELTTLAHKKELANGVNFNYRNNAAVQDMKARMQKGDTGRCLLLHGYYIQDWLLFEGDYNWRVESKIGGESRAIADIGSHWFDTVQVVTDKRVKSIYARNFTSHPTRAGKTVNTEDGSTILFEMEDGTPGSVVVSQVSAGYKNHNYISVDCEKYSMRWNQEQSDRLIIGTRDNGVQHIYAAPDTVDKSVSHYATLPAGHPVGWQDAHTNGIREFYKSLLNGTYTHRKQSYSTFEDATYIMKLVDACMKSSKEKKWIEIV